MDLRPGSVLSYSAGSTSTDPYGFRVVQPDSGRLGLILGHYPELLEFLGARPPLVVNCYPATLGVLAGVVQLDTYLRPAVFTRALNLAAAEDLTCLVAGQPLALAQLLLQHVTREARLPERLVLFVGGYSCPAGLEALLLAAGCGGGQRCVLHGYGLAEVDYGVLVGRRTEAGPVLYRKVAPAVEFRLAPSGELLLRRTDTEAAVWYVTGDSAVELDGALVLAPGPRRLSPRVAQALDGFTGEDWRRRTGYLKCLGERLVLQLRPGEQPRASAELPFYDFCARFGMSFADKPDWACPRELQQADEAL
jgi:hypothetical protein